MVVFFDVNVGGIIVITFGTFLFHLFFFISANPIIVLCKKRFICLNAGLWS